MSRNRVKIALFFKVVCVCLRIGRQMTYYDYTPTVLEFFMRILNLFLDFQSDVRFRRNDGFKIARHFESLGLLCVCGFLSLVLYCIAMYAGGHVVCVK